MLPPACLSTLGWWSTLQLKCFHLREVVSKGVCLFVQRKCPVLTVVDAFTGEEDPLADVLEELVLVGIDPRCSFLLAVSHNVFELMFGAKEQFVLQHLEFHANPASGFEHLLNIMSVKLLPQSLQVFLLALYSRNQVLNSPELRVLRRLSI